MLSANHLRKFSEIVGPENLHNSVASKVSYSYDGTFLQSLPEAILLPSSTQQVSEILSIAHRESIPIIPRGAGTSLVGGTIPSEGEVVLNLTKMNRILEIDPVDSIITTQPGVVTGDLQREVEKLGLFYPPDPASLRQCTIGGNAACNAGGARCLKYGVTKDYVLGMTVVLADGTTLKLGGKTQKNVTGYQLMQLFIGSEGTLGVITELTLRLLSYPEFRNTARITFPTIGQASKAVTAILSAGIVPVALELMDSITTNIVEDYLQLGLPRNSGAVLLMEQDGNNSHEVRRQIDQMSQICLEEGAIGVEIADAARERDALWEARRAISPALGRLARTKLGEDIVVPRSRIPDMVDMINQIGREHNLTIAVFGHAGDGNLHPNFLFDQDNPKELEKVEQGAAAILQAALSLGGTLSGEHGIGLLKRDFLEDDLGSDTVATMKRIKDTLDPKLILNPGKIFPVNPGAEHTGFLTALPTMRNQIPG